MNGFKLKISDQNSLQIINGIIFDIEKYSNKSIKFIIDDLKD